ncbi:MAG: hypothetical protein RBR65_00170 [Aliarcobacter sp.]|jgi:hypothetical protein|nr:hypothetical protein [Aliarcobacter sp.]
MRHEEIMCKFFNFSAPTYYKRKKEGNLAIKFIEKYFSDENILEFLNSGKINKLDNLNSYSLSSWMSFLKKLELLDVKEFSGYNYFAEFILHYILEGFEVGSDEKEYWIGENELKVFQNSFIKFLFTQYNSSTNKDILLDTNFENIEDIRYLTTFINVFDESNLLFLNMNIEDDFRTLKSFDSTHSEFYSYQKNTLLMFENSLLECLKKSLNKEGNLEELIFEYKSKCIKELEEN